MICVIGTEYEAVGQIYIERAFGIEPRIVQYAKGDRIKVEDVRLIRSQPFVADLIAPIAPVKQSLQQGVK